MEQQLQQCQARITELQNGIEKSDSIFVNVTARIEEKENDLANIQKQIAAAHELLVINILNYVVTRIP